jgi:hypothetical protein
MCKVLRHLQVNPRKCRKSKRLRLVWGLHLPLWIKTSGVRPNAMKTIFVVLFVLFATAAFAQTASVIPNQVQILELPDHPLHAAPHAMATESPIVGGDANTYTYAHGERPLWEFGPVSVPVPLGDVARAYRKEK